MLREYGYRQLSCEFCVGKNHCKGCAADIAQAVREMPGAANAEADAEVRTLKIEADEAAFEEIEDRLDAMGVFLSER